MQKQETVKKHATQQTDQQENSTPAHKQGNASGTSTARANDQESLKDSRLEKFFIDELKDIYWAEQKLVKTLPKLAEAASSKELKQAFTAHLKETEGHVERLERAFGMMGQKPETKKCEAIEGITEEGKSIIKDTEDGTATRDAGLVMAGQKAEHYEIATYGSLINIANTLGHKDVVELLQSTLEEEKKADQKLSEIAMSKVNDQAAHETK